MDIELEDNKQFISNIFRTYVRLMFIIKNIFSWCIAKEGALSKCIYFIVFTDMKADKKSQDLLK